MSIIDDLIAFIRGPHIFVNVRPLSGRAPYAADLITREERSLEIIAPSDLKRFLRSCYPWRRYPLRRAGLEIAFVEARV